MRSCQHIWVGPNPVTGILIRNAQRDTERREEEEEASDGRCRDGSDVATSQRTPGTTRS